MFMLNTYKISSQDRDLHMMWSIQFILDFAFSMGQASEKEKSLPRRHLKLAL